MAYGQIMAYMQQSQQQPAGMPITVNNSYESGKFSFDAAIPVTDEFTLPEGETPIKLGATPAGKTLHFTHVGPYTGLTETYEKIQAYLKAYAWEPSDRSWAQYANDPGNTPPEELKTEIYFPVK